MQCSDNGLHYGGIYTGEVMTHEDRGRCRVFVYGVSLASQRSNPDSLPIAEQAAPLFGGCNKGNGVFSYPHIGAMVWCMFQGGDPNLPVYWSARLGGENAVDNRTEGFQAIRPNVQVSPVDTSKDGTDSQQHMIRVGNTRITLFESGQVFVECADDENQTRSQVMVDADGSVVVESTASVQMKSPTILFSGDKFEVDATNIVLNADKSLCLKTPCAYSENDNSFNVKSPSINLNAGAGTATITTKVHGTTFYT